MSFRKEPLSLKAIVLILFFLFFRQDFMEESVERNKSFLG